MTPLQAVLEKLARGEPRIRCSGLAGSSKAFFTSRLLQSTEAEGWVYLAPSDEEAARVDSDLRFFGVPSALWPPEEVVPSSGSPHSDISCQRMAILWRLLHQRLRILVMGPTAIHSPLPPKTIFNGTITLRQGEEIDRDLLLSQLAGWGYQRVTLVTDPGTFAVRGALTDLFVPIDDKPLRVEWSGDLLESIRSFNPETQRSIGLREEFEIIPVRELIPGPERHTLRDYLRERTWILDGPGGIRVGELEEGLSETLAFEVETNELIRSLIRKETAEPLSPVAAKISQWLERGRVTLVASTTTQASRLTDLLSHYFPGGFPFAISVGKLSAGFHLPSEGIAYLTDEEIFGPKVHNPSPKRWGESPLSSLAEIRIGDPLVHKDHGIGIYQGLVPMRFDRFESDFLLMEYRSGDKLYLPVTRMNLVQRYAGGDGEPRVDRLGGTSWMKLRKKAEKAIREMAGELINLYAARVSGEGHPFSPPGEMFEAFEAAFPYEETPDQGRAIAETLRDLENSRPMDRLILGDVGYGKTEVAMRAAFLAALEGKQTAILVPTTLLAWQHLERFRERFRDLPVRIEMLSRFLAPREQKRVIREVATGEVDILIGTHRLLQPDISFKDLGLLVIDEEHRFGVLQKEKIKRLKKNVHVLAMSATPIPRTLYMSIVGIRHLSVIETPPSERQAIRTYVIPFEEAPIREAIGREIQRGGQVFFIHNRIETIGKMRETLTRLVPEVKIAVAHGQMDEEALEEIMLKFYHQEFQLLLCTTIVESGIDIPTANTILINDADQLGLAQVYQLRGRVGRGKEQAFAYLILSQNRELSKEASERFKVLQRFSDLGTGLQLASYDLEIRGAGNLVGREQAGHMAAIGYELYTELLERAVRELKGEKVFEEIDTELHFKIAAFIPEAYIPDPGLRLELYRRLSALGSEEELEPVTKEIEDRFGPIPPEVVNLLRLSRIKTLAKALRLKQIRSDGSRLVFDFDPSSPLKPEPLIRWIQIDPKHRRLTPDLRLILHQKSEDPLAEATRILHELSIHIPLNTNVLQTTSRGDSL